MDVCKSEFYRNKEKNKFINSKNSKKQYSSIFSKIKTIENIYSKIFEIQKCTIARAKNY